MGGVGPPFKKLGVGHHSFSLKMLAAIPHARIDMDGALMHTHARTRTNTHARIHARTHGTHVCTPQMARTACMHDTHTKRIRARA